MKDSVNGNRQALTAADLASQLKLINIAEIEVLQTVLLVINTQHFKEKQYLEPALVCALLLNHIQVPSLYATSPRGYLKQQKEYSKQCKDLVTQKLLPKAINEVLQQNRLRTLEQDVVMARNSASRQIRTDAWREIKHGESTKVGQSDIFDLLANLSLTNLIEGEVVVDAYSHIQTDYADSSDRIDLSDVCALVLNNENVPALYATNAKEYNQQKQSYLSTYQTKVRRVIRQVVKQVNREGSEHSFSANATAAKNEANARNVKSWNNLEG
ncbi:MAG: late competence development ComFB family protein [Cyanobacteria bacterium J06600_6]